MEAQSSTRLNEMKTILSTKFKLFVQKKREQKMAKETKALLGKMNRNWNLLTSLLFLLDELNRNYKMVLEDSKKFYSDNAEDYNNQNVANDKAFKRSNILYIGAFVISSILAVKGLKYFTSVFYGSIQLSWVLLIAFILVYVVVVGSIYLNSFAGRFHEKNKLLFYILKVVAFLLILFIPAINFLEGLDSQYTPIVMALNIVAIIVDVAVNVAMVSMSDIFIQAENAKKAKKNISKKRRNQNKAAQKVRDVRSKSRSQKDIYVISAKEAVKKFKEFEFSFPDAASNLFFLLDNFQIWMINNKVYNHQVLKYHANHDGQIDVETEYFLGNEDRLRQAFDNLNRINLNNFSDNHDQVNEDEVIEPSTISKEITYTTPAGVTNNPIDDLDEENDAEDDDLEDEDIDDNENNKFL